MVQTLTRLLAALAMLMTVGCSTSCKEIRAHKADFMARHDGVKAPHARVTVPFALVNRLFAERLPHHKSALMSVPLLKQLGLELGAAFELAALRMVSAPSGRLGFEVDVTIRDSGDRDLGTLRLKAVARPERSLASRELVVALHGGDLARVTPTLSAAGRDRLAKALGDMLPTAARLVIKRHDMREVLDPAIDWLVGEGFALAREHLLADMGEISRLALTLPELPLASMAVHSVSGPVGALVVTLRTTLPVERGLEGAEEEAVRPGYVSVLLAGDTVAEAANYAMAKGLSPSRFNNRGEPALDGEFEARLAWGVKPRPLKIHLWKLDDGECLRAVVGGRVKARLTSESVVVDVVDGKLEVVKGPVLTETFSWVKTLWGESIDFSHKSVRTSRINIARKPLHLAIVGLALRRSDVLMTIAAGHEPIYLAPGATR